MPSLVGLRRAMLARTSPYSPAADALFAAMTTKPNTARKVVIDTLIKALQAAGSWPLLDILYILAAADSQAALLNWKSPGTFTASAVSAPTFTADRGYTGNGTSSRLDTTWNPATNGVNFTLNSASFGFYSTTDTTDVLKTQMGVNSALFLRARVDATNANGRVNNALATTTTVATGVGLLLGIRRNGTAQIINKNGVSGSSTATASTAVPSANMTILSLGAGNFSTDQVALALAGGALSDAQALATYNALLAYLQAVGAA